MNGSRVPFVGKLTAIERVILLTRSAVSKNHAAAHSRALLGQDGRGARPYTTKYGE
jgi:hypothetical protein